MKFACLFLTGWFCLLAAGANTLQWHANTQLLDADLQDAPLIPTLEDLAHKTGWHIYLEPSDGYKFNVKFAGLARGEAMHKMIGDMNYAFVPGTDGVMQLFVFRTSRGAATYEIKAKPLVKSPSLGGKKLANQLVVKLRPGVKIEDLAAKLGAKVKARIGDLNAYLLEFENEAAMESARKELASNGDVESTDYN
ncbi:MAG: hypothetical protein RLY20_2149, partial [Verrucomicrobiota bacterium]